MEQNRTDFVSEALRSMDQAGFVGNNAGYPDHFSLSGVTERVLKVGAAQNSTDQLNTAYPNVQPFNLCFTPGSTPGEGHGITQTNLNPIARILERRVWNEQIRQYRDTDPK